MPTMTPKPTKFTRKDFRFLAHAIAKAVYWSEFGEGEELGTETFLNLFAAELDATNPNFDRDIFLDAVQDRRREIDNQRLRTFQDFVKQGRPLFEEPSS